MTERVQVGGLQVAKVLFDFVNNEAIPEPASLPTRSGPVRRP
ncbi:malate synthase G [Pseudomonas aeruginosa]|nr:malate synthase G [Pseudomonas aeruginosa]